MLEGIEGGEESSPHLAHFRFLFYCKDGLVGWLFKFYGISTFAGYLMPNAFFKQITVLFQTIQFSMSTQFNCQKHFYLKLFSLVKQF